MIEVKANREKITTTMDGSPAVLVAELICLTDALVHHAEEKIAMGPAQRKFLRQMMLKAVKGRLTKYRDVVEEGEDYGDE